MRAGPLWRLIIAALFFPVMISLPRLVRGQRGPTGPVGPPGPVGPVHRGVSRLGFGNIEKQTWAIFGKVTDLKGKPLNAAKVRVDVRIGSRYVRKLTTNLQGEFRTEYTFDTNFVRELSVDLLVEREGFHPAREFVDFGGGKKTWAIDVAMQPGTPGADDLPVETLLGRLAPPLRARLEGDSDNRPVENDLERGVADFLDRHNAVKALPRLDKVVKRRPECGDCRALLGLAMLQAGNWSSASREFAEAAKLAEARGTGEQKVVSLLILAELENWKGEYASAAGHLLKAQELDSKNDFLLQELGRTLIFQSNWQAAEEYLEKAIHAGARQEAHLLRAQALLEEGDPETADAELKLYLGGKGHPRVPPAVGLLKTRIQTRLNLRAYGKVNSLVSEPLPSLMNAVPDLKGLEPAASQQDLQDILAKTGESVRTFFLNFPNTISVEEVREERMGKNGEVKNAHDQTFQYLLLARPESWGLGLEEYRTDLGGKSTPLTGLENGFMLTSGFASASLVFHPAYQTGATFRHLGRMTWGGQPCHVVAYEQIPEKAQMVAIFKIDNEIVPVLSQGLAWIDAATYKVQRMRTALLKPEPRIRLQRRTTEIRYGPVQFKQGESTLWLPSEVAVVVHWKGRIYRNRHTYSDFKLFNVDTRDKVRPVEATPTSPTGGQP